MDPELYSAAVSGDLSYFENMNEITIDLEEQLTPYYDTALHMATEFHQTEFAKQLVQLCRPLLFLANSSGDTALHVAAGEGNKELVEFFIQSFNDIETGNETYKYVSRRVNGKKDTALHCAARRGRYECVEMLVKADPEVCSFVNNDGESSVYLLVLTGHWTKLEIIINDELESSSLASHRGLKGLNALHASVMFAVYNGYSELDGIEMLVKWRKEMIREGNDLGMNPLHYAALYGQMEVVELLINHDRDAIYIPNNEGESVLHLAAYNGHINTFNKLIDICPDCYKMVDKKGRTALHAAVLGEEKKTVEFILKKQGLQWLINKADKDGNTPLHLAVSINFTPIIKTMIKNKKVILDILNHEFLTPTHIYNERISERIQEIYIDLCLELKEKDILRRHKQGNTQLKKLREKGTTTNDTNKEMASTKKNENIESELKRELDVNLLVAALVATVTFAAGFTLPGGLVSNGEDEGLATLTNKPAFQAFIVFNSLAFYTSIFTVGFHFIDSTVVDKDLCRVANRATVKPFNTYAILSMMLAFCCGSYVMLTKSTQLAVVPLIISALFMFILLMHMRYQAFFPALIAVFRAIPNIICDANEFIKEK